MTIVCSIDSINKHDTNCEYRILGLQDQWVSTSSKHFEFVKLNAGKYTFEYRANCMTVLGHNLLLFVFSAKPFWMKPLPLQFTQLYYCLQVYIFH